MVSFTVNILRTLNWHARKWEKIAFSDAIKWDKLGPGFTFPGKREQSINGKTFKKNLVFNDNFKVQMAPELPKCP